MSPALRCRDCAHARYTPARGGVGCALLSRMSGPEVLRAVGAELGRLWRGRVHPAVDPDVAPAPADGFREGGVIVPAGDRCSRFQPRIRAA